MAVGAMGISPADFYNMTIAEVLLAQNGYMAKMEFMANLMLMANRQGQAKKPKLFEFASNNKSTSGANKSTLEERNKTLEALGINK